MAPRIILLAPVQFRLWIDWDLVLFSFCLRGRFVIQIQSELDNIFIVQCIFYRYNETVLWSRIFLVWYLLVKLCPRSRASVPPRHRGPCVRWSGELRKYIHQTLLQESWWYNPRFPGHSSDHSCCWTWMLTEIYTCPPWKYDDIDQNTLTIRHFRSPYFFVGFEIKTICVKNSRSQMNVILVNGVLKCRIVEILPLRRKCYGLGPLCSADVEQYSVQWSSMTLSPISWPHSPPALSSHRRVTASAPSLEAVTTWPLFYFLAWAWLRCLSEMCTRHYEALGHNFRCGCLWLLDCIQCIMTVHTCNIS